MKHNNRRVTIPFINFLHNLCLIRCKILMLQNEGENLLYIAVTFKLFYHKMDIAAVVLYVAAYSGTWG